MSRTRVPGDGPKCQCGAPAVWSGYCQMQDGRGYCGNARAEQRKPEVLSDAAMERMTRWAVCRHDILARDCPQCREPEPAQPSTRELIATARAAFREFRAALSSGERWNATDKALRDGDVALTELEKRIGGQ